MNVRVGRGAARPGAGKSLHKTGRFLVCKVGQRIEIVLASEQTGKEIEYVIDVDVQTRPECMLAELVAHIVDELVPVFGGLAWAEIVAPERDHRSALVDIRFRVVRVG